MVWPASMVARESSLDHLDAASVGVVQPGEQLPHVLRGGIGQRHVEHRPLDRIGRAQLVGGVGGEPALFVERSLQPVEHRIEGVGELAELIVPAAELHPLVERPGRHATGDGVDLLQWPQHPAGQEPAAAEADRGEHQEQLPGARPEGVEEVAAIRHERSAGVEVALRHEPEDVEDQGHQRHTGHEEEPGVAQGEAEAGAHDGPALSPATSSR
jgi:hypothetical protein